MQYFKDVPGINLNLIMMTRKLRESKGILSSAPPSKYGKPLSGETKHAVADFMKRISKRISKDLFFTVNGLLNRSVVYWIF